MAKKKRIGSSKKEDSKKFTFSADNLELTNLIKTLETKKGLDILPQLKSEENINMSSDQNEEDDLEEVDELEENIGAPPIPSDFDSGVGEKGKVNRDINKKTLIGDSSIFNDIGSFITELLQSYETRYDYWEESTNGILSVLRKMQMINRDNSNALYDAIDEYHKKIETGLERFRTKRDYVEQFVDTDFGEISQMLKKTLNLLALQLKEFKIKDQLNQIMLK